MKPGLIEFLERNGRLRNNGDEKYPYYRFEDLGGLRGSIDSMALLSSADAWDDLEEEELPRLLASTGTWVLKNAAQMWLQGMR